MSQKNLNRLNAYERYPGEWLALDEMTDECRAHDADPLALSAQIRGRELKGVSVIRAPRVDEPEYVGLG